MKDSYKVSGDGPDIQQTLKSFFENDLESGSYSRSHDVRLEEYDDQGSKAFSVSVDGKEIGSITGEDAGEVSELIGQGRGYVVNFGVNGHDIDEYERIIDRYRDKKFWKEEDPDFDDKEVNKAYNDLVSGMKKEAVYQAEISFPAEAEPREVPVENLSEEERKHRKNADLFVKYFRILFPLSIVILVMGILYLRLSLIMGVMNIIFGALGVYFSLKYTKPYRKAKKKQKQEQR